jgi:cullin 1
MSTANDFSKMPPKTADLDETWAFLNAGVDHIMNHMERGLAFAGYTSLYTTVYNYCTSTKMHGRLEGNRCECSFCGPSRILANSCALAGANLVGSDLYNKLSEYFIIHFRPMLQVR